MNRIYFPKIVYETISELPTDIRNEISFAMLKYVFDGGIIEFTNEYNKRLFNIIKSTIDRKNKEVDKDYLYIIKCFNENECFYKYGTTNHVNISNRFSYYSSTMPYNYESICHIKKDLDFNPVKIERQIKKYLKDKKYVPYIKFGGYTECFDHTEFDNVLKIISI